MNAKDCQQTDDGIEKLFESNDLQTKNFNVLKSEVQDRHQLFNDDAIYHIESFQKIRNKLVHRWVKSPSQLFKIAYVSKLLPDSQISGESIDIISLLT